MVSHSHLSAGNSESSQSHDLFVEYGVSRPSSPLLSSPLLLSTEDMGESDPFPLATGVCSDDSSSLDKALEVNVGPVLGPAAQDIFKAVHYFSQKDREDALSERKANQQLREFISAHGFSPNNINDFISEGKLAKVVSADLMLDKSPKSPPCPTSSFLGGKLVPVSCVGEGVLPERVSLQPVLSPRLHPPNEQAGPSKSWSNVVSNSSNKASIPLSFFPPSSREGRIIIRPPVDVLKRGNQLWASSIVGYFLHSKLPFKVVEPIAKRLWGNMGLQNVFLHAKGYYIFKFQTVADRDNVLASGSWHFASKIIALQPWKEGVEYSKPECEKFPVWVKLSNIPLSYWSAEGISYIASGIGKPLFTDDMTSKLSLLNYARVCIEIEATFSFPPSISVVVLNDDSSDDIVVPIDVEYQSRPPSCPSCKLFGHSLLKCPKSNLHWIPKVQPTTVVSKTTSSGPCIQPENSPANLVSSADPLDSGCPDGKSSLPNDWVTVSRGTKSGKASNDADPQASNLQANTTNSFSPIANLVGIQSDNDSPAVDNPLVSKLKIIDEKESKELKLKHNTARDNLQAAKRRNKGKGPNGNLPN